MFSNGTILRNDSIDSDFNYPWKDTMLHDVIHLPPSPELVSLDEMASPNSAQLLEFCDPDLFQTETITNSEVASSSNWSYEENSSYTTNLTNHQDIIYNIHNDSNGSNLSIILDPKDELENDISVAIDFSPTAQEHFDFSSLQPQLPSLANINVNDPIVLDDHSIGNTNILPPFLHADYLSSMPPSCAFLDLNMESYFPGGHNGGVYCPNSMQRLLNSGDLQGISIENHEGGNCTPLVAEITNLDESAFKVGKLSVEQRKEKINRYMKKRNHRNFNKKIKYACRKTLADSRPRVRGRFAKNEQFGDNQHQAGNIHDEDDNDNFVRVKEQDDMMDSSDIFAHISGVNSFKCNYSVQSWF